MLRYNKYFLGVTAAFFIFSVAFGGNLPFYIFYGLLIILILSSLYIRLVIKHFNVEVVYHEKMMQAGDFADILAKFEFDVLLPVPYVKIRSDLFVEGKSGYPGCIRSATWDENIWIENHICFYQRGVHNLSSIQVIIKDLFHVVQYEKNIQTGIVAKVYPRIFPVRPIFGGGTDVFRNAVQLRGSNDDPFSTKDVRKYKAGDGLNKIHWKLSAKHDDLFVKNPDMISGEEVNLFVDMHAANYSFDTDGVVEESIVDMAISIINHMVKKNVNVRVYLNTAGSVGFHVNGRIDFVKLMEYLLLQKSDSSIELVHFIQNYAPHLHRMNHLILVTADVSDALAAYLVSMRNSGYSAALFYCFKDCRPETLQLLSDNQMNCSYYKDFIIS